MSMDAVKASAADKRAQHEAKLQRQMLDWIEVVKPQRGNILVLRLPEDRFLTPGTPPEEATPEKVGSMNAGMRMLQTLADNLDTLGVRVAGAVILGEGMTLEAMMPPPAPGQETRRQSGLVLPPGTRV
jgi:hypothetical protein